MEVILELTQKEKKIILLSLLFTGCTDFCLDEFEQHDRLVELAVKLSKEFNINDLEDTELYLFGENFEDPEIVKEILKNFKVRHEK